jgi:hypothetical protein
MREKKHASDYIVQMRETEREDTYYGLQSLKSALPSVIVQGIATVNRAVITEIEEDKSKAKEAVSAHRLKLLVEGTSAWR